VYPRRGAAAPGAVVVAFRLFSTDDARAERLAAALHRSRGSLAVSWLNLGEYAAVTDSAQRVQAERLLERVLPAIYCIEVEPFRVIAHEQRGHFRPQADEALAAMFRNTRTARVNPFTASGLLEPVNVDRCGPARCRDMRRH